MDWSSLVSLVAVAVTGLSLWLSYRERTAGHRQLIYQKQIEAYEAILGASWALYNKTVRVLPVGNILLDQDAQTKFLEDTRGEFEAWEGVYFEKIFVCPDEVAKVLDTTVLWIDIYNDTTKPRMSLDVRNELADALYKAEHTASHALGIGPLSKEILSIVGERARRR